MTSPSTVCSTAFRYVCENLDEDLRSRRCRKILEHLDVCPACAAFLGSIKTTIFLYRKTSRTPVPRAVHRTLVSVLGRYRGEGRVTGRTGTPLHAKTITTMKKGASHGKKHGHG